MADDLAEKIRAVLSDPDAASKITALASTLGGGREVTDNPTSEIMSTNVPPSTAFAKDKNTALLNAVKPFLRVEKQNKLDSLIRAMAVAELISGLRKGGL